MGRIDYIMCVEITCADLQLASVVGFDDITCHDLTYDGQNLECVRYGTDLRYNV